MTGAGPLIEAVAFDAPVSQSDGQGGAEQGWAQQYVCHAAFRYLRGGETVQQARLSGRQPVVATIRQSDAALAIGVDWRMRDVRSGTIYNIRTIVPSELRHYLELTCESGVEN